MKLTTNIQPFFRGILTSAIAPIYLMLAGDCCAESTWQLKWQAPALYSNGSELPPGEIIGYKVYGKTPSGYQFHASTTATTLQVPSGTYAVAATFSGGQTGLSESVTLPTWESELEKPNSANTVSPLTPRTEIQSRIAALAPGGVVYLRGGEYNYAASGVFLDLTPSGTADRHVTIRNYPGEAPIITGVGWAHENIGPSLTQTLLKISGNYVKAYGLKIQRSGGVGISVNGSHCWVEECESSNNWQTNISCGKESSPGRDVSHGTIVHCKAKYSRQGSGIYIVLDDKENYNADGWTIKRCISYRNGFNADNSINNFGGGNSDGTGCTKYAHDNYITEFDYAINGRANRIRDFHVIENLLFLNADDGSDVSSGEGTLFVGNIAVGNGPSGTKGFKQLRAHYETSSYLGNIAIGSRGSAFPKEILYIKAQSSNPIESNDIVIGANTGATAKIASISMFSNGNPTQEWSSGKTGVAVLTESRGAFEHGEEIVVEGAIMANVLSLGQTMGCDHRANTEDMTKPIGRNNEIAWSTFFHNQPGVGSIRGISSSTGISRGGDAINNLSFYNQDGDGLNNFTSHHNFLNSSQSTPDILNPNYVFAEQEVLDSGGIKQQWRNLYREIRSNIMPTKGGNLYGIGDLHPDYYHTTAADDPLNPSDPDDHTKLRWLRSGKQSGAPDIGAVQYETIYPPVVLDLSMPRISTPTGVEILPTE